MTARKRIWLVKADNGGESEERASDRPHEVRSNRLRLALTCLRTSNPLSYGHLSSGTFTSSSVILFSAPTQCLRWPEHGEPLGTEE